MMREQRACSLLSLNYSERRVDAQFPPGVRSWKFSKRGISPGFTTDGKNYFVRQDQSVSEDN
jgi:hypothetical protein